MGSTGFFFSKLTFHMSETFKTWGKSLQLPYANEAKLWPNMSWAPGCKRPPRHDILDGCLRKVRLYIESLQPLCLACSLALAFSYFQSQRRLERVPYIGICRQPHVASQVRQKCLYRKNLIADKKILIFHCFASFFSYVHCTHVYLMLGETALLFIQSIGNFVASRSLLWPIRANLSFLANQKQSRNQSRLGLRMFSRAWRQSTVRKKMAAVHFTTIPCEPN